MDVNELIASLRAQIEGARSMPMSASAVINRSEVLDVIGQIEVALPAAFADSDKLVSDREALVAQARREADDIIAEATHERDRLISDTEVFRVAKHSADRLHEDAVREVEALRHETDEYVDGRLANFEIALNKTIEAVARGRERLHGRTHLGLAADELPAEPEPATAAPDEQLDTPPSPPVPTRPATAPGGSI